MSPKLAIIVGHEAHKPGTQGSLLSLTNEYEWNSELALDLWQAGQAKGLECRVFKRDGIDVKEVGRRVTEWASPEGVAIELHCNSFDGKATGTETLYDEDPETNREFAAIIQKKVISVFGVYHRKDRGTKLRSTHDADKSNDRGAMNLEHVKVTSCLIEPVFWDNRDEAILLKSRRTEYIQALISGVCEWYLKKGVK